MSSLHSRLFMVPGGPQRWFIEDFKSKNGTFVNGKRVERTELHDGDLIEVGSTFLMLRSVCHSEPPRDQTASAHGFAGYPQTLHPAWSFEIARLLAVARSTVPVFLTGETGTGKEVLARAVHAASGRPGFFTAVNCGAIARTIVESELFGARRGAFSGATEDRPGLVRAADRGTLFLDEIAELPESSQIALLRVLQEREVLPVGASRPIPVDLRIVAAAQEDLAARVAKGTFRADLYARLNGYVTRLPALRTRLEDVGVLIAELLPRLAPERARHLTFSRGAARALLSHAWPHNVRELEQALAAAIAVAPDAEIALSHLPEKLRAGGAVSPSQPPLSPPHLHSQLQSNAPPGVGTWSLDPAPSPPSDGSEARAERERILAALEAYAGNQTRAARSLGMSRATLVTKLSIHRLPRPRKSD